MQAVSGQWELELRDGALPEIYDWYVERALVVDEIDLKSSEGRPFFVAVYDLSDPSSDHRKPRLVVAQNFWPAGGGFEPGCLVVPETKRLFIGAGNRLLAYDLSAPRRLWEDSADMGFFRWGRRKDFVWMVAELEFAVWSTDGEKLWTTFVEPPWEYEFGQDIVTLNVMGVKRVHRLADGGAID